MLTMVDLEWQGIEASSTREILIITVHDRAIDVISLSSKLYPRLELRTRAHTWLPVTTLSVWLSTEQIHMSRLMTKPTKWLSAQSDQSSLCVQWVAKDPSFLQADSEDYQTGRMPRLIWVFAGRTVILLVLSWGGSYVADGFIWPTIGLNDY